MTDLRLGDVYPHPFDTGGASFAEVLRRAAPEAAPDWLAGRPMPHELSSRVVEGTTVLALVHKDGVVIAGDRRATAGNIISKSDMRKIFPADSFSAVGISGAAGPAMELARVFATELEHYEKVEGETLSLEGKSNKLAGMVRANLGMAMQGIVVVPLFAGVDPRNGQSGIFEYDPIGGRYAARRHAAAGSGSLIARQTLKHASDPGQDADRAALVAVTALFDAAEQDSATGGPDLMRELYPIVAVIDPDGYRELEEADIRGHIDRIIEVRTQARTEA